MVETGDRQYQVKARWETANRYYVAVLQVDLLGDWIVTTANGSRKSRLGNVRTKYVETMEQGLRLIESIHKTRIRHGYKRVV